MSEQHGRAGRKGLASRWGDPVARFWSMVTPEPNTGCWLWSGTVTEHGYGVLRGGQAGRAHSIGAHRFAWTLTHGEIPSGREVLHRCDNPPCCNPSHLFLGTQADNVADMVAKGRQRGADWSRHPLRLHPEKRAHGARHGNALLTEEQVRSILSRCAAGERQVDVARALGVNKRTVNVIVVGKAWRHVTRAAA
jgi:HNH endonuclease